MNVRALHPPEWPALQAVLAQSFNVPAEAWDLHRARLGDENVYVIEQDGQILGGCVLFAMGQYWKGRSVPLGGIGGVGVAPHVRGKGVARALMVGLFSALQERKIPVAGLFPATQRVYRSVGYEQSGERWCYQAPLAALSSVRQEVEMTPVDPMDLAIRARYRPAHGNLDRNDAVWTRLGRIWQGQRYAWLIGGDGYVILHHRSGEGHSWDLEVVDLCVPSAPSARSLLALLASHRSMATQVRWWGAATDPLLAHFPEPVWSVLVAQRWMLRIVDVVGALSGRGWPPGAFGELHLSIRDSLLPGNEGNFVLHVGKEGAVVERGGEGRLQLDISALGPLYSGYFSASILQELGKIEGDRPSLELADQLFTAPVPWMREIY